MRLYSFVAMGLVGVAQSTYAQAINPVITWDVSTDNGLTWSRNVSVSAGSPASVKIRGSLSWGNLSSIDTAFTVVSFDGVITGAANEIGSNIVRPFTQITPRAGLFANLGGGHIRFSDFSDTGLAGSNTNWWEIGQNPDAIVNGSHTFPDINLSNPAHFMYFDLAIDYSVNHSLDISCILSSNTGEAARVYVRSANGGMTSMTRFNRNQVIVETASIQVTVPAPFTLTLLSLSGFIATRRRR